MLTNDCMYVMINKINNSVEVALCNQYCVNMVFAKLCYTGKVQVPKATEAKGCTGKAK